MVSDGDFYARALSSLTHQISLAVNANINAHDHDNNENTRPLPTPPINVESFARSLVEMDQPKIDSAVKSYLSLVAARSVVASDTDLSASNAANTAASTTNSAAMMSSNNNLHGKNQSEKGFNESYNRLTDGGGSKIQCTFATPSKSHSAFLLDANRSAMICARTLLAAINSTNIPPLPESEEAQAVTTNVDDDRRYQTQQTQTKLQKDVIRILWNKLAQSASSKNNDNDMKQKKPSKLLGRQSLLVAYPYVMERLRRGMHAEEEKDKSEEQGETVDSKSRNETPSTVTSHNNPLHSLSMEVLPPVYVPKGIDVNQWEAFCTEFGNLLVQARENDERQRRQQQSKQTTKDREDDSALLWSKDRGLTELRQRRDRRARRAEEALTSMESVETRVLAVAADDGDTKDVAGS